jgi:hypothetical protein
MMQYQRAIIHISTKQDNSSCGAIWHITCS